MPNKFDINDKEFYQKIYKMYVDDKLSISTISKSVNCASDTLRNYMKAVGIKAYTGELYYDLIPEIQQAVTDNTPTTEIAKKYNVNDFVVRAFIRKHKIKRPPNVIEKLKTQGMLQSFMDDWNTGMVNDDISSKYNIKISEIFYIMKKLNLEKPIINRLDQLNKEQIIEDYKNGISVYRIGIKHKTSFSFITQILHEAGIDVKTISTERKRRFCISRDQILNLIDKKYTIGDISREYKVSGDTVRKRIKQLDIPLTAYLNCSRFTDKDLSLLSDMYFTQGLSLLEIAVKLKTDQETIRRFFILRNIKLRPQKNRYKKYKLPSGREIIIQGYEGMFLDYVFHNNILKEYEINYEPPIVYYNLNGTKHRYYPDFLIPKSNTIIEVKSRYTLKIQGIEKQKAKELACYALGYKYYLVMDNDFSEINKIIQL